MYFSKYELKPFQLSNKKEWNQNFINPVESVQHTDIPKCLSFKDRYSLRNLRFKLFGKS